MHMDFVCPLNERFQRDCKSLRGGICPGYRLMGMCRWMRLHFHRWIDYNNGVAFLLESLGYRIVHFWDLGDQRIQVCKDLKMERFLLH